jgi:hypothetical protein
LDEPTENRPKGSSINLTRLKTVSSYNWITGPSRYPTIAVPGEDISILSRLIKLGILKMISLTSGSPRSFDYSKVTLPYQGRPRHGLIPTDLNSSLLPTSSPYLPLVASVKAFHPQYNFYAHDFITDSTNLTRLWDYVTTSRAEQEFRIDVSVLKNPTPVGRRDTIVLNRWEKDDYHSGTIEFTKTLIDEWGVEIGEDELRGNQGHWRIHSYVSFFSLFDEMS